MTIMTLTFRAATDDMRTENQSHRYHPAQRCSQKIRTRQTHLSGLDLVRIGAPRNACRSPGKKIAE